ncbi:MAG TPA: hypothetical protein VFP23_09475 [Solirubrobacterales bacterium]|nr:hypothetical protein [Solirubrobacterales bacterium]
MAAILVSAVVTCFVTLFLGQAALRLAGAREWSWLAPAVGLSIAMLVATPTVHVPGRCTAVAILLGALSIAAAVWCLRSPQHRSPLFDLLAAFPVALLVLVPFLAAGRGGILGVTVDNDMAVHLAYVEGFLSPAVTKAFPLPPDYPLGPHALVAALSRGLRIEPDLSFSGFTMALPVLNAWIVLAVARRASWLGKAIAATVVGMPFLVAAYYGQGSFKEVAQAGLVLAIALDLSGCGPRLGRARWIPCALLIGGIVSVYSPAGLPWVVGIFTLWLIGLLAIQAWKRRIREVLAVVRRELPAFGIGLAVLVVVLLPQAHRIYEFIALREGTGIAVSDIGNLVDRLPGWEALGIWSSPDYRLPASSAFVGGGWSWFVVGLILFGTFWAFRRGRWLLPLSGLAAMLIWKYSDQTQSIYVSAKGLVIASPLLLLVAMLPLLDREPGRRPRWLWSLAPLFGLVLFLRVGSDDLRALRFSPVGPTNHARQLMSFRPFIAGEQTLFFGEDEFTLWELAGARFRAISLGAAPEVNLRPQKEWEFGKADDFDTVSASTLNEYEWMITPRDAASSEPPPQLRLVRSTEDFLLWKRMGRIPERSILNEGEWPGAVFNCDSKEGRAILARGGVAAIRRPPIVTPIASTGPGGTVSVRVNLPIGTWDLEAPYTSHLPVEVTGPGLRTVLPANLDRPGPRLPIGRVAIRRRRPFSIDFHVQDTALAPETAGSSFNYLVATRAGRADRVVPIDRACGRYVDWYHPYARGKA